MTKRQVLAFCAVSVVLLVTGIALPGPAGSAVLTVAVLVATVGAALTAYEHARQRR